ncbi:MAG: hypothetical protein RMJ51_05050 [Candidatus Calescibacterium sp.]|nr:hypothetical protein [Candidatus Calescibacterium sp.]MCX7972520.1 hypothetical protein [bacterium]MDW8195587.1 hypothetical protein [Candidatus Calescibacterium sp.]
MRFLIALFIWVCASEYILASTAKIFIKGLYNQADRYPNIRDMVLEYEFRAQEGKNVKAAKEEDIPLIGQGKIFYKAPYYIRIETEFLFHPSLQGEKLITIKDGKNVAIFKEDFVRPLKVEPDPRYPLLINFPFLYLLRYEEMDRILYPVVVAYEDIGSGELKGRRVAVISVIDKTKMYERYRIYMDIQNYFPVRAIFYPFEKDKEGIEVIYKGFSYVADGRIWAKKILIYKFSQKSKYLAWVIYLNNISINVGLIDDLFQIGLEEAKVLPNAK